MSETALHGFEKPTLNGDDGQWGQKLNDNWDKLDGKLTKSKSIMVELPTAAEDLSFFFTPVAITVRKMQVVLIGASNPSITWTIKFASDRSATGTAIVTAGIVTTNTSTGDTIAFFNVNELPPDSYIWLETSGKSGTVASLSIELIFTED